MYPLFGLSTTNLPVLDMFTFTLVSIIVLTIACMVAVLRYNQRLQFWWRRLRYHPYRTFMRDSMAISTLLVFNVSLLVPHYDVESFTFKLHHLFIIIGSILFLFGAFLGGRSLFKGVEAGQAGPISFQWIMTGAVVALVIGIAGDIIEPESKLIPLVFNTAIDFLETK